MEIQLFHYHLLKRLAFSNWIAFVTDQTITECKSYLNKIEGWVFSTMIEHLSRVCKTLGLNPSTKNKEKNIYIFSKKYN
jgi:hypothetical protein